MKKNILTTFTIVIFCIMTMKLFINATTECGSTSCSVPSNGFQLVRMDTGPFAHYAGPPFATSNRDLHFNYQLCLNWQLHDDGTATEIMNWSQVFYNSYRVFIKVETTDCASSVQFTYRMYCSQSGTIFPSELDYNGAYQTVAPSLGYGTLYISSIYISAPKDRPFRVTFTIYTRCEYSNNDDLNNKYNLVFKSQQDYSKNQWQTNGYLTHKYFIPQNCVVENANNAYQNGTPWNSCSNNNCQ